MDILFVPLFYVILAFLRLYQWCVMGYVILGWLEAFQILNRYNRFVYAINGFLFRLVEPALVPLRRFLPNLGNIDLSPLILFFVLFFIEGLIGRILLRFPA